MRSSFGQVLLSRLRNGAAQGHGWFSACAVPCVTSERGPSTSGRQKISSIGFDATRTYSLPVGAAPSPASFPQSGNQARHRRDTAGSVRFLTTAAATGPPKANTSGSPSAQAESPIAEQTFPVGLAQLYPNPDDVPEHVLRRIRQQLFGNPVKPGEQTGRRALARPLQGRAIADWYFMPPSELPGFHNEEREYNISKALNRRHRKRDAEEGEGAAGGKAGGKKK